MIAQGPAMPARRFETLAATDPAELERRVDQLHRGHMLRTSLAAKQARARKLDS